MELKCGRYKHYKGNTYTVYGIAKILNPEVMHINHNNHDNSIQNLNVPIINEVFVLYQENYGNNLFWIRPTDMFLETIKDGDKSIPRFELLEEISPEESIENLRIYRHKLMLRFKTLLRFSHDEETTNRILEFKQQKLLVTHSETNKRYEIFDINKDSNEITILPFDF